STSPTSPRDRPRVESERSNGMPSRSASAVGRQQRSAPVSTTKRTGAKSPNRLRTRMVTSGEGQDAPRTCRSTRRTLTLIARPSDPGDGVVPAIDVEQLDRAPLLAGQPVQVGPKLLAGSVTPVEDEQPSDGQLEGDGAVAEIGPEFDLLLDPLAV